MEPGSSNVPLIVDPRTWDAAWKPDWYLRLRLRALVYSIDRLQNELASSFATLDTAPLHDELSALVAEHDDLVGRLKAHG